MCLCVWTLRLPVQHACDCHTVCVFHLHDMSIDLEGLLQKQTVLETQDLPCMCLAHHEPASLESVVIPCPVFYASIS